MIFVIYLEQGEKKKASSHDSGWYCGFFFVLVMVMVVVGIVFFCTSHGNGSGWYCVFFF